MIKISDDFAFILDSSDPAAVPVWFLCHLPCKGSNVFAYIVNSAKFVGSSSRCRECFTYLSDELVERAKFVAQSLV